MPEHDNPLIPVFTIDPKVPDVLRGYILMLAQEASETYGFRFAADEHSDGSVVCSIADRRDLATARVRRALSELRRKIAE